MITLIYAAVLLRIIRILKGNKVFELKNHQPAGEFSIIIPFRNEQNNLPSLIASLNALRYPQDKFEVIFVNDHSIDASVETIRHAEISFPYLLLDAESGAGSPKKNALLTGIRRSRYSHIITLDADVTIEPAFLQIRNDFLVENSEIKLISAPVLIEDAISFIGRIQKGEFLALQALTEYGFLRGNPFLSNGANLSFDKSAFFETGAYAGHMDFAGGDDIFLMEKFKKHFPTQLSYLKSPLAAAKTKPVTNLNAWIQQRVRWSKKTAGKFNFGMMFLLLQMWTFFEGFLLFAVSVYRPEFFVLWLIWLMLIIGLHYRLLRHTARTYRIRLDFPEFLSIQIALPLLYVLLGLKLIINSPFEWKGRRFDK